MLRFARPLALSVTLGLLSATPVLAGVGDVVWDLRETLEELQYLRDRGSIEFRSMQAEQRYMRSLRRIRQAIRELEQGGGGGHPGQNRRGAAVLAIREHVHSAYASDVIARLPSYVTEDDLVFVAYAAEHIHSAYVADAVGAFYRNPSDGTRYNRRGLAGRSLVTEMHSSYLMDTLKGLPSYVSESDAEFVAYAADELHSAYVADALVAYGTHPSSQWEGNRKGDAGKAVIEQVHSAYVQDCLKVLPSYVSAQDASAVTRLLGQTHSSRAAQALREFFGTAAD